MNFIDLATLPPRCRMASEETFSFRVRELAPAALRVLDMQDMEALRRGAPPGCRRPCRPAAMVCGSAQKSEGKTRSQAAPLSYSSHRQCGRCEYKAIRNHHSKVDTVCLLLRCLCCQGGSL